MFPELVKGAIRNLIWFGSLGALSVVQGWLSWEFWGAFTDRPAEQAGLRAIGLAFVGAEVVALDMASRAALNNEKTRANTLRALWLSLAVLNLGIDINTLSRVLQEADHPRVVAAAAHEARKKREAELRRLIDEADDPFPDGRLLTVSAYDAALASKLREINLASRALRWRQRLLERERGELEAARATARQVADWRTELDRLAADLKKAVEVAPEPPAREFQPLADALSSVARGTDQMLGGRGDLGASAEDVRAWSAIGASIVMKLMLTFGVWAGLDRSSRRTNSSDTRKIEPKLAPALLSPTPDGIASQALGPRPAKRLSFARFGRRGAVAARGR